jgi:hypothetical protein
MGARLQQAMVETSREYRRQGGGHIGGLAATPNPASPQPRKPLDRVVRITETQGCPCLTGAREAERQTDALASRGRALDHGTREALPLPVPRGSPRLAGADRTRRWPSVAASEPRFAACAWLCSGLLAGYLLSDPTRAA